MSPEQSADTKAIDHRCDIYSLGCTLFFLLHGRPPFIGESKVDTMLMHRNEPIPSLQQRRSDISESVDQVFQKMIAKSPDDRFQSMTEVTAALKACEAGPKTTIIAGRACNPLPDSAQAATEEYRPNEPTDLDRSALLVEPSAAQAMVIRGFLQSLGFYSVQRCRTGAEALESFAQSGANVVVSAMHLDDMTSVDLTRRMMADTPGRRTGFILISSSMDAKNVEGQASGLGTTLLAKPFDEARLSDALRGAVTANSGTT